MLYVSPPPLADHHVLVSCSRCRSAHTLPTSSSGVIGFTAMFTSMAPVPEMTGLRQRCPKPCPCSHRGGESEGDRSPGGYMVAFTPRERLDYDC
ncbi:hypothetical protein ZEAMMB73_Zm00001d040794 [Zea mays]|uniref:Uncharacterized protein n=1 Tax=Zea mays TaxID=4577 RepID=A0A1D6MT02_MAIZE|nr:hypothetical protein ZEAMMB73_Zm00001d040794 [Zea mays]